MLYHVRICLVSLLVVTCCLSGAAAATLEEQALQVFNQHKDAVVTVELVVEQNFSMMGMGGESEEMRIETTGTVIDNTGLIVVALSATDPMSMVTGLMGGMLGDDMKMQSKITDANIQTDGTPIPAKVILRDKDNDLAFIRPITAPEPPLPFIDLSNSVQPGLLDPIVVVERLGKVASRIHTVDLVRITGIVERPRLFYLTASQAVGAPAFSSDGSCVGIFVVRMMNTAGGSGFSPLSMISGMSGMQDSISVILKPVSVITEAAAQAPP
ncbi:MAG: trypsin-like peptidase domain-containing protein, partial [Candidatus Hydrogenedentes bacterium]|nr:trypsin-like peptidase domain-containing protein [Candidatus Hydrogenedentota bacterium]